MKNNRSVSRLRRGWRLRYIMPHIMVPCIKNMPRIASKASAPIPASTDSTICISTSNFYEADSPQPAASNSLDCRHDIVRSLLNEVKIHFFIHSQVIQQLLVFDAKSHRHGGPDQ